MEDPQRGATPKTIRASKLSQTFSRFKGIIRIPHRKPTPNATSNAKPMPRTSHQLANYPYQRQSALVAKPYMSQPMLGLQRSSTDTDHPSDPDSEVSSGSTDTSPTRMNSEFPLPTVKPHRDSHRLSRTLSMHSLASPPLDDFAIPKANAIDGLPPPASSEIPWILVSKDDAKEDNVMSPQPPTPPPKPEGWRNSRASLSKRVDSPPLSRTVSQRRPLPPIPQPMPSVTSTTSNSMTLPITATPKPSSSNVPTDRSEAATKPTAPFRRPLPVTYKSSPAVPPKPTASPSTSSSATQAQRPSSAPRNDLQETSGVDLPLPEVIARSASEADSEALQQILDRAATSTNVSNSSMDAESTTTTTPKRELPPKLTLPTSLNRRISLLAGARLSPSIVLRTPPLPILNLPKLPVVLNEGSTSGGSSAIEGSGLQRRRSERVGLGSMPALPLQGATRGAGGHEEPDDMEDEDEMEDIDEEEDMDDEEHDDDENFEETIRTSTSTESTSSEVSSEGLLTGRGSYDLPPSLQRIPSQPTHLTKPELPPLSLFSPLDVRFQGDSEVSSSAPRFAPVASGSYPHGIAGSGLTSGMVAAMSGVDKKGKNKQIIVPSSSPLSSGYASSFASSIPTSSSSFMGSAPSTGRSIERPSLVISPPNPLSGKDRDGDDYFNRTLEPQAISHSRSDGSDKTPSAAHRPNPFDSPLQTPRAESSSKFGPSSFEVKPRPRPAQSQGTGNRNSAVLGTNARNSLLIERPSVYRRNSRSLVDLHAIERKEEVEKMVRDQEQEQEREHRRRSIRRSIIIANAEAASPSQRDATAAYRTSVIGREKAAISGLDGLEEEGQTLPKPEGEVIVAGPTRSSKATRGGLGHNGPDSDSNGIRGEVSDLGNAAAIGVVSGSFNMGGGLVEERTISTATTPLQKQQNRVSLAPAYEVSVGVSAGPLPPLRKRRSMPMFNEATAPPPYPTFAPHPFGKNARFAPLQPREDEGKEALPPYSNSIYLKAILPRKMEFSAPGVQAKDRKWKRVLCVLEGTMLKVYRCPVGAGGVSAIEQWWESKVGAGDVALQTAVNGSSSTASGSSTTNGAAAAGAPAPSREEEKATQQYLRSHHVHDELRSDGGPQAGRHSTAGSARPMYGASQQPKEYQPGQTQAAITKSALSLAVHYFKPGTRHTRSNSDGGSTSPTVPRPQGAPRPSLNLPSGSSTPSSSTFTSTSRSHSPLPSSSSSSMVPPGSRSHSPMPSQSSSTSRLGVPSNSSGSGLSSRPTTPSSGSSKSSKNKGAPRSDAGKKGEIGEPHPQDLIRCYTMQNAESGLGNDYLKRKNVIRVRLEGEQFLLQAKDVPSVVEWIEGLQAATNIALDLDERPMPRGPIFPRRRRRRRPQVPPITTNGTVPTQTVMVTETYTPTSATAGQPALRRT